MIRVHSGGRFLATEDGKPFFYLADTAWELFNRLTLQEAEYYLRDRASKGFTVIQAVALAELDGLRVGNIYGHRPFESEDVDRPNEAYWRHVDAVFDLAKNLGLTIGFLPTWGDKWNKGSWGVGPEIFNPDNAHSYGRWLGERYKNRDLIWILGGDRAVDSKLHREIIEHMAKGIQEGDGGTHLKTFHPSGGHGSSEDWTGAKWIDFHMWQSGHGRNSTNYKMISSVYESMPPIPVLDGEPGYEDHPAGFDINNGYLEHYDVRKSAYWSVFAGACGHTYGCHPIWQFYNCGRAPLNWTRNPWVDVLDLPGAHQMIHLKNLIESRPFFSRIPDQSLIVGDPGSGSRHVRATRDSAGTYAFVYFPDGSDRELNLSSLVGKLQGSWFNPRSGFTEPIGPIESGSRVKIQPPKTGPDWVLVIDSAESGYGRPG